MPKRQTTRLCVIQMRDWQRQFGESAGTSASMGVWWIWGQCTCKARWCASQEEQTAGIASDSARDATEPSHCVQDGG